MVIDPFDDPAHHIGGAGLRSLPVPESSSRYADGERDALGPFLAIALGGTA